jgi:hypothetical protein
MKLATELDAWFIRYETRVETWDKIIGDPETWHARGRPTEPFTGPRIYSVRVETLAEAQGVFFQCPLCHLPDGSGHYCEVTFADRGVPDEMGTHNKEGKATRWSVSGTSLADLTTKPSILLQDGDDGCHWHGYITNRDAA